jgi:phenol/toluene 2-monooxygenase (NADH) P1/A1
VPVAGLRRYVEDTFVVKDPFELWIAQNVALDGLLYPLVYGAVRRRPHREGRAHRVDADRASSTNGSPRRPSGSTPCLKTAAAESAANADLVAGWYADGASAPRKLLRRSPIGTRRVRRRRSSRSWSHARRPRAKAGVKV